MRSCVALEDSRKGRPVGDVEERQGADGHVQIDRINVIPEDACSLPARGGVRAAQRVRMAGILRRWMVFERET